MEAEQAAWQQAGIKITLTTASFNTVIGNAVPCSGKSCTWELENWSGGWVYAPDYYPSGELLFQTGAGSNSGSYSDKKADALIHDTAFGDANLTAYQNYLAVQLPVVWQPNLGVRAHRGPEEPARRDPAEHVAQHQPRGVVLHEVDRRP